MDDDMAKNGTATRDKIIETAMGLSLRQGHVATSIDEVIENAGITKGSFFYHFPSKKDLAVALIEKFSILEIQILEENLETANKLSNDPLQQLLIFVGLIKELHTQLEEDHIGCLFASFSYENQLQDEYIQEMASKTLTQWKVSLSEKIKEIIKSYPSNQPVDPDDLADMFLVTLEGAYVLARVMRNPNYVQLHLEQYKTFLESLFKPT